MARPWWRTAVIVAVFCTRGFADEPTPTQKSELANYLSTTGKELGRKYWSEKAANLKAAVALAKRGKIDKGLPKTKVTERAVTFPSAAEKAKFVEDLEADRKAAENAAKIGKPLMPDLHAHRLMVGAVGRLRGVRRLGDDADVSRRIRVVQVLSEDKMIVEMGRDDYEATFVLHAKSTGLVDGGAIDSGEDCFEVIGTYGGTTVLGATRTMFEVQRLDVTP